MRKTPERPDGSARKPRSAQASAHEAKGREVGAVFSAPRAAGPAPVAGRAAALVIKRHAQLLETTAESKTSSGVSAALDLFTRAVEAYAQIPRERRGTSKGAPIAGAYVSAVRKEAGLRILEAAANLDPKKRRDAFDVDNARWGSICAGTLEQALCGIDRVEAIAQSGTGSLLRKELARKLEAVGGVPAIADALEQQLSRTTNDWAPMLAKETRELAVSARRMGLTGMQERLDRIEAKALTQGAVAARDSFAKYGVRDLSTAVDVTSRFRSLTSAGRIADAELPPGEADRITAAVSEMEREVVDYAPAVAAQCAGEIRSAVGYFSLTIEEQMRRLVEEATRAGFVDAADPRDAITQLREHKNHFGEADSLYVERHDRAEAVTGIGVSGYETLLMDDWSPVVQLAKLHWYVAQRDSEIAAVIAEQLADVWPGTGDVISRRMAVVERAAQAGDVAALLRYVQTPAELRRIVEAAAAVLPRAVDVSDFRERAARLEARIRAVFAPDALTADAAGPD